MKLGLFGGSFDPVHLGHLLVAHAAIEEVGLDRLFFIPAAQSPFKSDENPAPALLRLRWLRLALAGQTRYEIDEQELQRGGVSYAIDTVRDYAKRFPGAELSYLVGADQAARLHQWREPEELARLAEFVVLPRPGEAPARLPPPFRGRMLRGFSLALSSSEIRARVRAGLSIEHLVPPFVAEAVRAAQIYAQMNTDETRIVRFEF